jgi:hypothetical protein
MFYCFKYQRQPIDGLHIAVTKFIRKLRKEPLQTRFYLDRWCIGELLERAKRSARLKTLIGEFYHAYQNLDSNGQASFQRTFSNTNSISRQLQNRSQRNQFSDLPVDIQAPAKKLFLYLYQNTIKSRGTCLRHWQEFYSNLTEKACPFCGIETLRHPEFYKQDYDHILCKSEYPLASVNMRNLVPMGRDCNTIFKGEIDVIFDGSANRKFPNPFGPENKPTISLKNSTRPRGAANPGDWKISFYPNTPETERWAEVFNLKERYKKEFYDLRYQDCLDEFMQWAARTIQSNQAWTTADIKTCLSEYIATLSSQPLFGSNFLKSAIFELLLEENSEALFKSCILKITSIEARKAG